MVMMAWSASELSFSDDSPFASGQALSLPGEGDVRVPHADSLLFAEGTMTLAHWIKAVPANSRSSGAGQSPSGPIRSEFGRRLGDAAICQLDPRMDSTH